MVAIQIKDDYLQEVERFVEQICNQYKLSDNYFGNILISLLEMIDYLKEHGNNALTVQLKNGEMLSLDVIRKEQTEPEITTEESAELGNKSLFMINRLTDKFSISEDQKTISLQFDISNTLRKRAEDRGEVLKNYLSPREAYQKKNH
ncbi:MAG: hypothetical protein U5Q03_14665 [Bacteroidota bacterium]|nr:hypothetical protein [Bacteroidota bacterium]